MELSLVCLSFLVLPDGCARQENDRRTGGCWPVAGAERCKDDAVVYVSVAKQAPSMLIRLCQHRRQRRVGWYDAEKPSGGGGQATPCQARDVLLSIRQVHASSTLSSEIECFNVGKRWQCSCATKLFL